MLNPVEPISLENESPQVLPRAEVLEAWAKAVLSDSRNDSQDYLEETVVPYGGE